MTIMVPPADTVSEAWVNTVRAVHDQGDTAVHTVTTVAPGGGEDGRIRAIVDKLLQPGRRSGTLVQPVDTVANTIFPRALYRSPGFRWTPDLPDEQATAHDGSAKTLFDAYDTMLPMLRTVNPNRGGTYFGRMIDWPNGGNDERTNQLADRIKVLRTARRKRHSKSNIADIAIAGDGESEPLTVHDPDPDPDPEEGLQVFAATDKRIYGFPCLVHVDLSVHGGRLHLLAVYRHWYLITKGYGNLLGLSDLQAFLCDQTGYPFGELVVVAGMADNEAARGTYGGRRGIKELLDATEAVST